MVWPAALALHTSAGLTRAMVSAAIQPASGRVRLLPGVAQRVAARPLRAQIRCMASHRDEDKSWADIGAEAVEVGKNLLKKVGSTVSKTVSTVTGAILPKSQEEQLRRQEQRAQREELDFGRGGGLLGGLMGRVVGSMLGGALREVGSQMRQAQEQVAEVQRRAAAIIESSSQVRERLGDVRVGAPVSQSSMTQIVNGVSSRRVTMVLPVASSRGQAAAEVSFMEGGRSGAEQDFNIRLRLPSGGVLNVDVDSSTPGGYAGKPIDVEWREL